MTATLIIAGKSGEPQKLPPHSYFPNKGFVIEVCWWRRLAEWPKELLPVLQPEIAAAPPPYGAQPIMRESRFCEDEGQADAFIKHCKAYRPPAAQPGYVLKMTYELYALTPHASESFEQA